MAQMMWPLVLQHSIKALAAAKARFTYGIGMIKLLFLILMEQSHGEFMNRERLYLQGQVVL